MSHKTLFVNATVVSPGKPDFVLADAAVLVEGGFIAEVGPSKELSGKHRDAAVVNVAGRVLMPGLVNAHMHLYSTFACGLGCEPAHNFPEILRKLWWKLDRALSLDDVYYSALVPYHRAIVAGTTTVIDHHASPYAVTGSLDVLHEAAHAAGLRSCFCYETSDRDGKTSLAEGLEENARFARKAARSKDHMVAAMFGLHASLTVSDTTVRKAVEAAGKLKVGIHVHAAEDVSDQDDSLKRYGKRVVARFADLGALGPRSILAHCIHVDEKERALLKKSGTFVVHNPQSNMNNAVGAADVLGMLKQGIHVGLGTDGMTSDMMEEARIAMLLHRQVKHDPTVAFCEAVDLLTRNNAAFASKMFGVKLGVVEKGAAADLIVVEHYPFTPISAANWYGHFLFGAQPSRVTHTMCNGKLLMAEGVVLTLNLSDIAARARALSPETWKRFGKMKEQKDW
jgi:putative selenium metabolism protein SsnA